MPCGGKHIKLPCFTVKTLYLTFSHGHHPPSMPIIPPRNLVRPKWILCTVHHTILIICNFVCMYRSNIGSHSFLAGLHRLVELQLTPKSSNDPFYIVRLRFNGLVLTEACQTNDVGQNYWKDDDNDLEYAHDAIQVLFSFFIRVNQDDIESGGVKMKTMIIWDWINWQGRSGTWNDLVIWNWQVH